MLKKAEAATFAAAHSLWVTASATAGALLLGAYHVGATDSPQHLLLYAKVNAFQCLVTTLIAPLIRAGVAAAQTKGNP